MIEFNWTKEEVLAEVAKNGGALGYASKEMCADREVVLAAVANYGMALKYAPSKVLRADRELVLVAVTQNGDALEFASGPLQEDKAVVLVAVTQNGLALRFAEELQADREVVLAAVAQNGLALRFASDELCADRELVLAAVAQNHKSFQFVLDPLRSEIVNYQVKHGMCSVHKALIGLISAEAEHRAYTKAAAVTVICSPSSPVFKRFPTALANYTAGFFTRAEAGLLASTHSDAAVAAVRATQGRGA